uniref:Farnesoic acid O-methyl transferase domain-containing protein n=1 Tax=Megaselia scalaris TaxID=36166 RepID=T1GDR2_MEGSC
MNRVLIISAVLTFTCILLANGGSFNNCKVNIFINTTDIKENYPQENELHRFRLYVNGRLPFIKLTSSGQTITFGEYKNETDFAIFREEDDYFKSLEPCSYQDNIHVFADSKFVEVWFILEKTGHFSIIAGNMDNGFALSCNTGFNFTQTSEDRLYTREPVLYDCGRY